MSEPIETPLAETVPVATAPVEEDVFCPLCGYNLRGLTEPRCPECGHRFQWQDLLDRSRLHPYLFEHQHGLRALIRTCFDSMRSRQFWQKLQPTHEPNQRRLLLYWAILVTLGLVLVIAPPIWPTARSYYAVYQARQNLRAQISRQVVTAQQLQQFNQAYGSTQGYIARCCPYPNIFDVLSWQPYGVRGQQIAAIAAGGITLLWPPLTFLALMTYRRVFQQAQIRRVHLVRIIVYSADVLLLLGPLMMLTRIGADRPPSFWEIFGWLPDIALAAIALVTALLVYRLCTAVRLYLRIPLVAGVLLTQMLVICALVKIYQIVAMGW